MSNGELLALLVRLLTLSVEKQDALQWFIVRQPSLGGRRPVDCEYPEVDAVIGRLEAMRATDD